MTTFVLTFIVVVLVMLGLGVGTLFGRARLTRSCGVGLCPCDAEAPSCGARRATTELDAPLATFSSRPESGS
jgi:hypothetical protein